MNVQIYEEATQWLVKHRAAGLDAREKWEFDGWLRASPQHVRAYLEMSAVWEEVLVLDPGWNPSAELLIARARSEDNVQSLNEAVRLTKGERRLEPPFRGPQEAARSEPPDSLEHPVAESGGDAKDQACDSPMMAEAHIATLPGRASARSERHSAGAAADKFPVSPKLKPLALVATLLAVVVGITLWYRISDNTYATAVGEQRTIVLADGSTVEMDASSRIRIRYTESRRDVDLLEGQALFQVAHNAAWPFIVHSGIASVRAVGTQFDVYRKRTGTIVTVVEGRVAVLARTLQLRGDTQAVESSALRTAPASYAAQRSRGTNAIFVATGEQLTIPIDSARMRNSVAADVPTHANIAAATAWTRRELVFDSAPLAEVVAEFNRYNTRQLVITDPSLASIRITGIFSSVDASLLLKFLRAQHELSVEATGAEIRIGRRR